MSFMKGDLLARVRLLVRGGVMEKPLWLDAVEKVPPMPIPKKTQRAPKIVYPEDRFIESYYFHHPEAKMEPFSLLDYDPPPAKRFALRQLEVLDDARQQIVEERQSTPRQRGGRAKEPVPELVWNKWLEKEARRRARDIVECEVAAVEKKAEEEYYTLRMKALREGLEPPPLPEFLVDPVEAAQEEEQKLIWKAMDRYGKKLKGKPMDE
eukprot:TRINITY_DN22824_c0_g1_i1.p1 TRINITY_DN22824_c0_g1~~TRINITY_DN22824_c0_g1_i1.p1  ORF type:complete len:209 (+),score=54.53 TRINITY_DN22824_c0_g1_i1:322-948(+)